MRFLTNCIVVQAHTRMIQRSDRQHHSYLMRGTLGGGTMTRARISRRYHVRKPFRVSILAD